MVGLVVTPVTDRVATRSARLPLSRRSRDRASSQIETPASARFFSRLLMMSSSGGWDVGGAADRGSGDGVAGMLQVRGGRRPARGPMDWGSVGGGDLQALFGGGGDRVGGEAEL